MSFLDIFKNGDGDHEVEPQTEMAKTDEATISVAKNDDLSLSLLPKGGQPTKFPIP